MSYSDSVSAKTLNPVGYWGNVFTPWNAQAASCLQQTAYWITFFVLGFFTLFIPHMMYYLAQSCAAQFDPTSDSADSSDSPETPIARKNPPVIVPIPSLSSKKEEEESTHALNPTPHFLFPPQSVTSDPSDGNTPPKSTAFDSNEKHPSLSFESFSPSFDREDDRIEILESLRQDQLHLSSDFNPKIPPLRLLCMRIVALQASNIPTQTMGYCTNDVFVCNIPAFRMNLDLQEEHVKGVLRAWPNLCDTHTLYLNGCTHITLTESILVHLNFMRLGLNGCRFENINSFAHALAKQHDLTQLNLGLEPLLSESAFQAVLRGCPKLESLVAAIDVKNDFFFHHPSPLKYLTMRIPVISSEVLENILLSCPNLQGITFWTSERQNEMHLCTLIQTLPLQELKHFNFIIDNPLQHFEKPHIEMVSGTLICLTQVDTTFLSSFAEEATPCNFWDSSFISLVRRFAHDAEKMHVLLKQTAQKNNSATSLNVLWGGGQALVQQTSLADLIALEKVFEPFSFDLGEEFTIYNINLEFLLRVALDYCCLNTKKIGDEWDEKKKVLIHLLQKYQDTFEGSFYSLKFG